MEEFDKFVREHVATMVQALYASQQNPSYIYDINYSRLRHKCEVIDHTQQTQNLENNTIRLLFETEFRNNSSTDQSYSFKAERETECVVHSSVTRGVTFSGDVKMILKTPDDVMENYAGLKKVLKLEGTVDQSITDTVKWSVDNMINVPAHTTLKGELHVHERSLEIVYRVENIISGKVIVIVKDAAENNKYIRNMDFTIAKIVEEIKKKGKLRDWRVEDGRVVVPSTITVKYSYAVKQDVNIIPVENSFAY